MAFATPDIRYEGTTTHVISRTPSSKLLLKNAPPKTVTLLKIKLSEKVKKAIQNNAAHKMVMNSSFRTLPSFVQLGMKNVPVLDQGLHGTCATFAVTAALNAIRAEGDYYSELCSLNLGKTLADNGYSYSGWDGQNPKALLARIEEFGLVSKADQRTQGCGGITEYPVDEEDESSAMSIEDFHAISSPSYYSGLMEWSSIFDISKWLTKDIPSAQTLQQTKTSLYYGNRVVIGALIPMVDNIGLSGKYHVRNDAWVLTGKLEQAIKLFSLQYSNWGGHAMVITGYDDNAVAIDDDGYAHKGLFTLRNSWGSDVGDNGNFYMSYDYFSMLTIELEEMVTLDE